MKKGFYSVKDVQEISGFSEGKSYEIIRKLNIELKSQYEKTGKPIMILKGRIPIWFFEEMTGMKGDSKNES